MKRIIGAALLSLGLIMTACSSENKENTETQSQISTTDMNNATAEELAGISKALDLYVNAAVEGDSKVARPAFAEGATISHIENDSLICLPIQALFDYYDETGKQPASYEIAECNVANDIAMVRIESKFGGSEFTDMFALAKANGEWKIISKVFTVK